MRVGDLFGFASRALSGHRLRTALSLGGVAIGVAAVILLTALGEGARRYVMDQFATLGTNLMVILPGRTETTGAVPGVVGVPNDLTLADMDALAQRLHGARYVAPLAMGTETVSFGERRRQVAILGTTHHFLQVRDLKIGRGRFLPEGDTAESAALVVLGATVADELFGVQDPVGEIVRVGDWRMRVIGVMSPVGTQLGIDLDDVVLVPAATNLRMFNKTSLFRIFVRLSAYTDIDRMKQRARELMIERHGEEDFTILTEESLVSTFSSILNALTLALGAIAAISLSVAGLGIMNVMLVAVSERTGEVGLLRALGVRRGQIAAVFLVESVLLSSLGGAVGLGLGWLAVHILVRVFPALPASPPVWAVIAAVVVSIGVGAFFGFLPARRASLLDPAAALGRK